MYTQTLIVMDVENAESLEEYCSAFVSCVVLQAVQRYVLLEIKERLTQVVCPADAAKKEENDTGYRELNFEQLYQPIPESNWIPNDDCSNWSCTSIKTMQALFDIQLLIESCQRALLDIQKSLLCSSRPETMANSSHANSAVVAMRNRLQKLQNEEGFFKFWSQLNEFTPEYIRSSDSPSLMQSADGKRRKMSSSRRASAREYLGSLFVSCLRRRQRVETRKDYLKSC